MRTDTLHPTHPRLKAVYLIQSKPRPLGCCAIHLCDFRCASCAVRQLLLIQLSKGFLLANVGNTSHQDAPGGKCARELLVLNLSDTSIRKWSFHLLLLQAWIPSDNISHCSMSPSRWVFVVQADKCCCLCALCNICFVIDYFLGGSDYCPLVVVRNCIMLHLDSWFVVVERKTSVFGFNGLN